MTLKCLVIFYHKNIQSIYPSRWVEKNISSILNQTYQDFDIWELNYGNDSISLIIIFMLCITLYLKVLKVNMM